MTEAQSPTVIVATRWLMDVLEADEQRILRGLLGEANKSQDGDREPGEMEILTVGRLDGNDSVMCLRCKSGEGVWIPKTLGRDDMVSIWRTN